MTARSISSTPRQLDTYIYSIVQKPPLSRSFSTHGFSARVNGGAIHTTDYRGGQRAFWQQLLRLRQVQRREIVCSPRLRPQARARQKIYGQGRFCHRNKCTEAAGVTKCKRCKHFLSMPVPVARVMPMPQPFEYMKLPDPPPAPTDAEGPFFSLGPRISILGMRGVDPERVKPSHHACGTAQQQFRPAPKSFRRPTTTGKCNTWSRPRSS